MGASFGLEFAARKTFTPSNLLLQDEMKVKEALKTFHAFEEIKLRAFDTRGHGTLTY